MSKRRLTDDLLDLLFPPRCQVCGCLDPAALCDACLVHALYVAPPICLYCGTPLQQRMQQEEEAHRLCSDCRSGRWLSGLRAVGLHARALRDAIISYKFDGRTRLAATFGRMLADVIEIEAEGAGLPLRACAALIPVPLHPNRRRWRGFDQAVMLCDAIAEHTQMPIWPDAMARVRDTPPQTGVTGSQRLENVRGAFEASGNMRIRDASLILVDDVFTTGATMEECALVLRRAGAAAVYGLTVTRGTPGWHPASIAIDDV